MGHCVMILLAVTLCILLFNYSVLWGVSCSPLLSRKARKAHAHNRPNVSEQNTRVLRMNFNQFDGLFWAVLLLGTYTINLLMALVTMAFIHASQHNATFRVENTRHHYLCLPNALCELSDIKAFPHALHNTMRPDQYGSKHSNANDRFLAVRQQQWQTNTAICNLCS